MPSTYMVIFIFAKTKAKRVEKGDRYADTCSPPPAPPPFICCFLVVGCCGGDHGSMGLCMLVPSICMRVIRSIYVKTQIDSRGKHVLLPAACTCPRDAHTNYRWYLVYVWYNIASLLYLLCEINYILRTNRSGSGDLTCEKKRSLRCFVTLFVTMMRVSGRHTPSGDFK